MQLIITEKDNAARRIAEILSEGTAETERERGVNVYRWGDKRVIGLSGHVVGLDFPEEYSNWRDAEPVELLDAELVTEPTQENIVRALESLADKAQEAIIATDYDREGELIGKEAYELVADRVDGPIQRVRFSSITDTEVRNAFANPDDLDFDLAAAGEARQIIDLMWGATLTRFLSLSARQLGNDFISVGRVQSPTLKLIVDREREIEAFDPQTYWELFADLAKNGDTFEAQYFYEDDDGTEAERVWDGDTAESVHETLSEASSATVTSVSRRTRTDAPPAPFNTTAFISAAGSLGYSAQRAMSIAEDLYTAGYVTYPRTDNTVYPEDLDPESLLDSFVGSAFGDDAESLLAQESIEPTEGDEETTDHPPIHPTAELPARNDLDDDEWEIYELVVRRFFATVAEAATWEHLRVVAETDGHRLKANGKRLLKEGYHAVYPYASTSENYVPDVDEGEQLDITDLELAEKETQPPRRYGQSRLIQKMEEMEVGTKCLTSDSKILVRNESNDVVRKSIGSLFEEGQTVVADGDTDIATTEQSLASISLNEERTRLTNRQQTLVSERPLQDGEQVYRIKTERGSFSVTEDHPLYVWDSGKIAVQPASDIDVGTTLVAARPLPQANETVDESPVLTWEEFAAECDKDSKLYGVDCNDSLARARNEAGESQQKFAERLGTYQPAVGRYENNEKDVPVWLLGNLSTRPDRLHGLNYSVTFENPFPLSWSPELARVLASILGDGSVHHNPEENVIDIRYHNTDRALIEQFVDDCNTLFDIKPPVSEREGHKDHHRTKYQVSVPSGIGRILRQLLDTVRENETLNIPESLQPAFIGSLFDDEGHISREPKIFISNTDHDLLGAVQEMLERYKIETKINTSQHKLYIRGRRNIERFLDVVPITSDEKFYRGHNGLLEYPVTQRKAQILDAIRAEAKSTEELAGEIGDPRPRIQVAIRELREDEHVKKVIEGSNRSHDGNRVIRYRATNFENSIYKVLRGHPSEITITAKEECDYDGHVYDLTIDETAPNFAVQGGAIVHNSTRHHIIEKLYDRGYLEEDPPRPTALAEAVVEAAEAFAEMVVSEEMTAQLEADMTAIAEGEATLEDVTEESREMLGRIFEELRDSRDEIGDHLQESLKADRRLGPCPDCGDDLLVRQSRQGSYFVGCDGFPECEFTLPLPSTGEPLILDDTCEQHDTHHVKMLAGRDTFVHGCPRCAAAEAEESEDRIIGACPECGDGVAPEEQRDGGGETADEAGGELAIKQLRSGSRLAGCTRYPDCEYSLPLPRRGDIVITDEICEEHDLPGLEIHDGDDEPWELGCPVCNYQEYQARQAIDDLEDLNGIGATTAERLSEAGIESPDDLAGADPDELATQVQGVTADRCREWQKELAD